MKILHLSNTPLSNAPANLAECQRHYQKIDSKVLLSRQANLNKVFVGGELWRTKSTEELVQEFETADVLHFHNFGYTQDIFKEHPALIEIADKKNKVLQFHSPRYSTENFEDVINDPRFKKCVIAQYHVRQYPEAKFIVPNLLPLHQEKYTPIEGKWLDTTTTISYAPSNVNLAGWDDKGFSTTTEVLREVARLSPFFHTDIIVNTPYDECMLRKRWAHIGIDEVMTGSYHLSSLEYMAMGAVPIANIDSATEKAFRDVSGFGGALPWIRATKDDLLSYLKMLLKMPREDLAEIGNYAKSVIHQYWNPAVLLKRYDEVYFSL